MHALNPYWGGLDYIQDTPAEDGCALVFLPSLVNDAIAGALQLEDESGAQHHMQARFRMATENMLDAGLVVNQNA